MTTTKYPLGFAGFVDERGSIIGVDIVLEKGQSSIPTGPVSMTEAQILELNLNGRQAPIPTGPVSMTEAQILELNLNGRQAPTPTQQIQSIIEAQKKLEAAIVGLAIIG